MKPVAHLFIARRRAAIVWFTVCVVTVVSTAVYVHSSITRLRTQPQYVIAGGNQLYSFDPKREISTDELYGDMTRMAMETIYNRSPGGFDHQVRRFSLFSPEVDDQFFKQVVAGDFQFFRDNQAHQKVEIGPIEVHRQVGTGEATTIATGQVLQTSVQDGRLVNRIFSVQVFFTWLPHPVFSERGMFPEQCTSVDVHYFAQIFP